MAIDYGRKRVGIAVTDENKIIASALTTVHSKDVLTFLQDYFKNQQVECVVVGEPKQMSGEDSEVTPQINTFIRQFQKQFPAMTLKRFDERFTSSLAKQALLESGLKKKQRQQKELVDMTSAVIILQSYMEQLGH